MAASQSQKVFGEPDRFEFDYLWTLVKTGFWLWMMSGFSRLPTQDEVMAYDPRWISDMKLAYQLYAHKANNDPVMHLFEEYMARVKMQKELDGVDVNSNDVHMQAEMVRKSVMQQVERERKK